jgi:Leucine Rich repeat
MGGLCSSGENDVDIVQSQRHGLGGHDEHHAIGPGASDAAAAAGVQHGIIIANKCTTTQRQCVPSLVDLVHRQICHELIRCHSIVQAFESPCSSHTTSHSVTVSHASDYHNESALRKHRIQNLTLRESLSQNQNQILSASESDSESATFGPGAASTVAGSLASESDAESWIEFANRSPYTQSQSINNLPPRLSSSSSTSSMFHVSRSNSASFHPSSVPLSSLSASPSYHNLPWMELSPSYLSLDVAQSVSDSSRRNSTWSTTWPNSNSVWHSAADEKLDLPRLQDNDDSPGPVFYQLQAGGVPASIVETIFAELAEQDALNALNIQAFIPYALENIDFHMCSNVTDEIVLYMLPSWNYVASRAKSSKCAYDDIKQHSGHYGNITPPMTTEAAVVSVMDDNDNENNDQLSSNSQQYTVLQTMQNYSHSIIAPPAGSTEHSLHSLFTDNQCDHDMEQHHDEDTDVCSPLLSPAFARNHWNSPVSDAQSNHSCSDLSFSLDDDHNSRLTVSAPGPGPGRVHGVFAPAYQLPFNSLVVDSVRASSLRQLNLSNCKNITDVVLTRLQFCTNLTMLNVHNCRNLTDLGFVPLLENASDLQFLDMAMCDQITDATIATLADKHQLKHLNMERCKRVSDAGIEHLADLKQLEFFSIARCMSITMNVMDFVSNNTNLKSLSFAYTKLGDSKQLSRILEPLEQLELIDLSGIEFYDADVRPLHKCSHLSTVVLANSSLRDMSMLTSSIEHLDISFTQVKSYQLARHLRRLVNLRVLRAESTRIDDSVLASISHCIELEELNIGDTHISALGLSILAPCTKISKLNMSCTSLSNAGMQALSSFPDLIDLKLDGTEVSNHGLRHLRRCSKLKHLDLSDCRISGVGVQHIAELHELETLELCGSGISNDVLANLAPLTQLNSLSVSGNPDITDRGVRQLLRLRQLRHLNLSRTRVTHKGVALLRSLPCMSSVSVFGCETIDYTSPKLASVPASVHITSEVSLPRQLVEPLFDGTLPQH